MKVRRERGCGGRHREDEKRGNERVCECARREKIERKRVGVSAHERRGCTGRESV